MSLLGKLSWDAIPFDQPLPLISSGGTSVFLTLASLGILLNVTKAID